MKQNSNAKTVQVTTTILSKDYESLKALSAKTHKPMSEIIREYIINGMSIDKNKDDIDFIRKQIREELNSVMDGYMNRLIKLLIRIGTMTITMCFFTSKLLYVLMKKYKDTVDYDTMFNESKKKSATFLGIKDESIDDACKQILS